MPHYKLMFEKVGKLRDGFSSPMLENLKSLTKRDITIGLGVFLVAMGAYMSFCTPALINGDAAVYVEQMQDLNFKGRSVHIGYYYIGAAFLRIMPGSDDYAVNIMNCLLGAVAVSLVYFIALLICHRHIAALLSSALLLSHYIFFENSVYAEVYTPRAAFLLLAIFLWLLDRPILAGVSFAVSALISTSTIFALPLIFILRPNIRKYLLFFAVFGVIAAAVIAPVYKGYFFGPRSLEMAFEKERHLGIVLSREWGEVLHGFFVCIPLVAVGAVAAFSKRRLLPFGIGVLSLWAASILGEKDWNDFTVQLPTYVLLCVVAGFGIDWLIQLLKDRQGGARGSGLILAASVAMVVLAKISKTPVKIATLLPWWFLVAIVVAAVLCAAAAWMIKSRQVRVSTLISCAVIILVATNGLTAYRNIRGKNQYLMGYRETVLAVDKVAQPGYLLVTGWMHGILFGHYVDGKGYNDKWVNTQDLVPRSEAMKKLQETVSQGRQIWTTNKIPGLFNLLEKSGYKISTFRGVYMAQVQKNSGRAK